MIPFNKPYLTGRETHYIHEAVISGKISGNGLFTKKCQQFFENRYGFKKCLLTTSCTDALEMAAILCNIQPGDEVIIPSYTFVSTALAFIRQGATIIFADSLPNHPNIDTGKIEALITPRTKVIVPVHYAGTACNMSEIMLLADKYGILVVEDAAQAIDSYYTESVDDTQSRKSLGSIGHLAAFSFHETKNIIAGEGGMLAINDERFIHRSEIIWEKGTNRAEFFRGEVNKYGWVDIGSSFLPSEIIAAYLWAQLENIDNIQDTRIAIWNKYFDGLKDLSLQYNFKLAGLPTYATNNGHMFYLICNSLEERTALINHLKDNGILAVFHYLSLHKSDFYVNKHDGRLLENADYYSNCLIRLPFYFELDVSKIEFIIDKIREFYEK
jgi:dTDP-4-amino-4,6-dideoxygalactose transaminase